VSGSVRELTARLKWRVDDRELNRDERAVARRKRQIGGLQKTAMSAGKALAGMFAARAIVRGATQAADAAVAFDRTLADIQGLLPGQTQRVKDLGGAMRDLSVESGKSATDLSKATFQIISAIGDTASTVDNLRLVTQLATAGNTDALVATDLLTAVTLAYGDTSLEAQKKTSDLAVTTIRLAKTTLPELRSAVGQVTSSWKSLGGTQEGMFAGFTALAGVTGDTQKASVQLSASATALIARTPAMEAAFKKLGVTSAKALVAKKGGIVPALQAVVATTDGSGEAIKKLLGNVRAMRAVMNLTSAGAGRFSDALKENANAAGATERGADAVANGAGKMAREYDKAKTKAEELELAIGDRTKGPLLNMRLGVLDLATALSKDLGDSFDVAESRANKFAESDGFNAIQKVSQAMALLRIGGEFVGLGLDVVGGGIGAVGAAGAAAGSAAVSIAGLTDATLTRKQRQEKEARLRASLSGVTSPFSGFNKFLDDSVLKAQPRIEFLNDQAFNPRKARATANAARESMRITAERGEANAATARRAIQNIKATISGVTVTIEGGSSPETVISGLTKFGESLGDRLGELVGDQTKGGE